MRVHDPEPAHPWWGMETSDTRPLVATADPRLRDPVLAAVAAAGLEAELVEDAAGLAALRRTPSVLVVGVDLAPALARQELNRRVRVQLVGERADSDRLCAWSAALGASVTTLPEGMRWLTSTLAGTPPDGGGRLVAVLGGSGGVGASTLAVDLAWQAAQRGTPTAVVELDPAGPGLDLLLGVESEPGWRWPALRAAEGYLGELRDQLPARDGLAVLAQSRGERTPPPVPAVRAVLRSLRREHDLVLIDVGRRAEPEMLAVLDECETALLVCRSGVTGVAAAVALLDRLPTSVPMAALLRGAPADRSVVGELLGIPVVAEIADDHRVAAAADRGELPSRVAGRGWRRGTRRLLTELVGGSR
ncbi:hypothetical protein CGZ98_06270 [Enemella evansiae]|nr:hypothetical protein CGZ98_06270 [Enemella evansiae]